MGLSSSGAVKFPMYSNAVIDIDVSHYSMVIIFIFHVNVISIFYVLV